MTSQPVSQTRLPMHGKGTPWHIRASHLPGNVPQFPSGSTIQILLTQGEKHAIEDGTEVLPGPSE